MAANIEIIQKLYTDLIAKQESARKILNRPMTFTEKVLYTHLWENATKEFARGKDYVDLAPDRVAMQDATAQMALLQFMHAGKKSAAVPATAHADHLIVAQSGSKEDLER
ncbi:MAG: aconitate hydratase, partial [Flavobacterium sp.]|nr:aconitate hydratase [Flavobacterium sp.]